MSKQLPLTRRDGAVLGCATVDDEDYDRFVSITWRLVGKGYAGYQRYGGKDSAGKQRAIVFYLHRLVLGLTHGDGRWADHVNGDRLDCRKSNLRIIEPSVSNQNRGSRNGFRGVDYVEKNCGKRHWRARYAGRHLGMFDTAEEAAEAAAACRAIQAPYSVERTLTTPLARP